MYDAMAYLNEERTAPAHWTAYFAEFEEKEDYTLNTFVENLWLPRGEGEITASFQDSQDLLVIDYLNEKGDPALLEVVFPEPLTGWLAGDWAADQLQPRIGKQGSTVWSRGPPKIDQVVNLDLASELEPSADTIGMNYPGKDAQPRQQYRRLLIVGENLPRAPKGEERVSALPVSDDDRIQYEKSLYEEWQLENAMKTAFDDRGRPRPKGKDLLGVNARLETGVTAGTKRLSLGAATGTWVLGFNDMNPQLRFTRTVRAGPEISMETIRKADSAFLELTFETDRHLQGRNTLEIGLYLGERKPQFIGSVPATLIEDEAGAVYRTEKIFFYDQRYGKANDQVALNIPVDDGMVFLAKPLDKAIRCKPARIMVDESDNIVGEYWLSALNSVPGSTERVTQETAAEFAAQPTKGYRKQLYVSRLFTGDFRDRTLNYRNGEHAAAILIKDEFIQQMKSIIGLYRDQAYDPEKVKGFIAAAKKNVSGASKDGFWKHNKASRARVPDGIPLWELLETERAMERFSLEREDIEQWLFEETETALQNRYKGMRNALMRAEGLLGYQVDEMLIFAGYKAPQVIGPVINRLVIKKDGQWVPDEDAINYVKGLYVLGAAMRALDAYNEIDNTYNALAIAVITGGTSGMLELGGYASAAAYTSMFLNTADMLYSGGYGVYTYFKGEERFDIAQGLSPIYGDEVLDEAAAGRQSGWATALGVLFPGQAAVREAVGLPGLKQLANGKNLASEVSSGSRSFSSLSDAEKADVVAYFRDVGTRRVSSIRSKLNTRNLTGEDLKNYRTIRKELRPPGNKPIWEMTPDERRAAQALRTDRQIDEMFEESGRLRPDAEPLSRDTFGLDSMERTPTDRFGRAEYEDVDSFAGTQRVETAEPGMPGSSSYENAPGTERMTPEERATFAAEAAEPGLPGSSSYENAPGTERMTPEERAAFAAEAAEPGLPGSSSYENAPGTERMTSEELAAMESPAVSRDTFALDPSEASPSQPLNREPIVEYDPSLKTGRVEIEQPGTAKTQRSTPEELAAMEAQGGRRMENVEISLDVEPLPGGRDPAGAFGANPWGEGRPLL